MPSDNCSSSIAHIFGSDSIGERVFHETYVGSVRYVGPIDGQQGVWIGVEWDDPKRGKHNGSYGDKCYFQTKHPTSGSFLRPGKLTTGIGLLEAVHHKYGLEEAIVRELEEEPLALVPKRGGQRPIVVEMVGVRLASQQLSQLEKLRCLNLHGEPVACLDAQPGTIEACLPAVEEIYLTKSLINSWMVLAEICAQFPHLSIVEISENRLLLPEYCSDYSVERDSLLKSAFTKVCSLVANQIDCTWPYLVSVLVHFHRLDHLVLAYNRISPPINSIPDAICGITFLDLTGNDIDDFETGVWQLGLRLVKLEKLVLSFNRLPCVVFPPTNKDSGCGLGIEDTELFPALKCLGLTKNCISEWESVNQCNRLSKLEEILLLENPVLLKCADSLETARQIIIAKMGRLKRLDHMDILREDRRGAEIDYLKRFGEKWIASGGSRRVQPNGDNLSQNSQSTASLDFQRQHPRYEALVDKYGPPEIAEFKKLTSALKQALIRLKLSYSDRPVIEKTLPDRMTVQHLRALLRRLFKLPGSQPFALVYTTSEKPDVAFPIDCDTRELTFYDLKDGDMIHVRFT